MDFIKKFFVAAVLVTVIAFSVSQASAAIMVDGTVGMNEYANSVDDASDAGTSFASSDMDIEAAYFGFTDDGDQFVSAFDIVGSGSFADALDVPTVVTLSLYGSTSDPAPEYTVALHFYDGTTTPSFVSFIDLNDGGSFLSASDYTVGIADEFEFALPQTSLSDLFPDGGQTSFAASIGVDQDLVNNNEEVYGSFSNVPVPEPATAVLLALGGATMFSGRLRRGKKA